MANRITEKRLREIVVNGTYCGLDEGHSIAAELLAARAEVERLKDDAARWHNLLPVYEDAEQEVKQLRADLREAMELLQAHGQPPDWLTRDAAIADWNRRYGKLLAKHQETP